MPVPVLVSVPLAVPMMLEILPFPPPVSVRAKPAPVIVPGLVRLIVVPWKSSTVSLPARARRMIQMLPYCTVRLENFASANSCGNPGAAG